MKERKFLPPAEIVAALGEHEKWLATGEGKRVDFTFTDLTGFNFTRVVLRKAKLMGAGMCQCVLVWADLRDLCDANLSMCDLTGCDLRATYLRGAILDHANLENCDLRDGSLAIREEGELVYLTLREGPTGREFADLTGVSLHGAKLARATIIQTDLTGSSLKGANLANANLSDSKLTDVDLSGAHLVDANLANADLCGADLSGADVTRVNFRNADLATANLDGVDLSTADTTGASTARDPDSLEIDIHAVQRDHARWVSSLGEEGKRAEFEGTDFSQVDFRGFEFGGAALRGVNFEHANLAGVDLSMAELAGANFGNANMTGAVLRGADLTGCTFCDTNLRAVDATPQEMRNREGRATGTTWPTNLSGANMAGSNLAGARLTGAKLRGANLTGAKITDADFTDADLTDADLNGADLHESHEGGGGKRQMYQNPLSLISVDAMTVQAWFTKLVDSAGILTVPRRS